MSDKLTAAERREQARQDLADACGVLADLAGSLAEVESVPDAPLAALCDVLGAARKALSELGAAIDRLERSVAS